MANGELAKIFYEMALFLDMQRVPFKPRAFEKASFALESLDEDARELYAKGGLEALESIPDVGKGIAERIEEYIKTGRIREYEQMRKKVPVDLSALKAVPGLGPKTILLLWKKLKIRNLQELENAARRGRIQAISHLGAKTEENILKGLSFLSDSGSVRFPIGFVYELVRRIEKRLGSVPSVQKAVAVGSFRRMKETVGDADFLAVSSRPKDVMNYFTSMPEVVRVYAKGPTKSMVRLSNGLDCDLRVVPRESFGAALNYFTGSKAHNVALREIAIKKGLKLNEYGLFRGQKRIAGKSEEELYRALGLRYIEPELREHGGEIEAARSGALPARLVGYDDLKGDLQVQTDWTDGAHSIETMAEAARARGLEYIAITDHTRSLAMTGGSDERKLERQMKAIARANKTFRGKFRILSGAEVNILRNGSLDIADRTLAKLDFVGAAVHSHFGLSRKEMTERVIRAMEHPHVDAIFHPTGRKIQKRAPYELDMEAVVKAAKRTGTILEIDASPDRLDLKDEYVRMCVRAGVSMIIDSDAHSVHGFGFLPFGIGQARRGWAEKRDILNTKSAEEFLRSLKGKGRKT